VTVKAVPFGLRVFVVGAILRLIPVLLLRHLGIGLDDMYQYDMLARSLAAGNGFRWYASQDLEPLQRYVTFDFSGVAYDSQRGVPTSFRAPLYPAFLALIYWLTGAGPGRFLVARLVQAFLSAALAPLTYLAARRFLAGNVDTEGQGERAARLAAWTMAVYPILLLYPLALATENLFFVLLLASFLVLLGSATPPQEGDDRRATVGFVGAGVLLGLTALTRSIILPFAGGAVLWGWFVVRQRRAALGMALAFGLTIAPWVTRNSLLHGQLTGVETSLGYNLYLGYHPQGNGSFVFGPSFDLIPIVDDLERDRLGTQKAMEFLRASPERFFPLMLNRLSFFFGLEKRALVYFYSNNLFGYIPFPLLLIIALILFLPFVVVSVSAALGTALLRRNAGTILFLLLVVCYVTPHALILAEDRFHLALIPYFAMVAAQFWTAGWTALGWRWREGGAGRWAVVLAVIMAALLIVNWGWELVRDADRIVPLFGPNGNRLHFPY